MDGAKLIENTVLCYLSLAKIHEWLKENNLWKKDFTEIKKQWQDMNMRQINSYDMKWYQTTSQDKEVKEKLETDLSSLKNLLPNQKTFISFFIDTELLITDQDLVLLQVSDENVQEYLAKNYSIHKQEICQKIFGENKHLILLTKKQWKFLNENNELNPEKRIDTLENLSSHASLVLFKDETILKNKLAQWLKTYE